MSTINWMERVAKWRTVFSGWQLGTRVKGDPESDAVRDHREVTIMMRAEVNALGVLLANKGVITADEFTAQVQEECRLLCEAYERRFPGFKATDYGLEIQPAIARDTMAGWKP